MYKNIYKYIIQLIVLLLSLGFPLVDVSCYLIFKKWNTSMKKTCQQHELPFKRKKHTVFFPEVDPSTKNSPDRWPHYRDREKSNLSANDDSPVKFQHRNLAPMGSQNPPMCQNTKKTGVSSHGFFLGFFLTKKVVFICLQPF